VHTQSEEEKMYAGEICTRVTHTAAPDETVRAAAARMEQCGVGTLVVVGHDAAPIGIVTDRDIAVRCVAPGLDPNQARVADIMAFPPRSVREDTPIDVALRTMAGMHVRRCPVVDREGSLVGLLSLDDVLDLLAEEVGTIGTLVRAQAPR
jgi:CBS domain-containing protein